MKRKPLTKNTQAHPLDEILEGRNPIHAFIFELSRLLDDVELMHIENGIDVRLASFCKVALMMGRDPYEIALASSKGRKKRARK